MVIALAGMYVFIKKFRVNCHSPHKLSARQEGERSAQIIDYCDAKMYLALQRSLALFFCGEPP